MKSVNNTSNMRSFYSYHSIIKQWYTLKKDKCR